MEQEERTVIVNARIIDNFIESSKNVAYWRQEMKRAQTEGEAYIDIPRLVILIPELRLRS